MNEFITNNYGISLEGYVITSKMVAKAAKMTNEYLASKITTDDDVDFFSSMTEGGALSSAIGSSFNKNLVKVCGGNIVTNPVKGGNPDILNISTPDGREIFNNYISKRGTIVEVLNPKEFGYTKKSKLDGAETKCTSFTKTLKCVFDWGLQRVTQSNKFTYSAHHNDNLIGIIWDFVDGIPQIVAAMYSILEKEDWGNPHKTEGNKSTNGYSLNAAGIDKMKHGWLCVLDDPEYVGGLDFPPPYENVKPKPITYRPKAYNLFGDEILECLLF